MALLDANRSILVLVDLQARLLPLVHRPALVLEASRRLMRLADLFSVPVVLTEQYPRGIGPTEPGLRALYDGLTTPTFYLAKTSFGCCGDPGFEPLLQQARPGLAPEQRQIVLAGVEAHICVLQTALGLLASGHEVQLCWEAVSGRGEEYLAHALTRMTAAGASLTNHESVGFEWARSKDHAGFKALSALLKEGQPGGRD